jgi:glycosyltransferase involved in cell wall biosynthesis
MRDSKSTNGAGRFEILTAGTLIKVKGFGLAIKAFKEFTGGYSDTRFSIIGSGPEEPRLRSLVRDLQLEDKVRFLASMPRDDVLKSMTECDVFLFPSLRDGGGTVAIEAMAVGRPVVCLDTGGPSMHVTEKTGIKVAPTSPEESVHNLAAALGKLAADVDLRRSMGDAGRDRAEKIYHWDRLGERLNSIYGDAVAAHQG